jgi:hypothetical protein
MEILKHKEKNLSSRLITQNGRAPPIAEDRQGPSSLFDLSNKMKLLSLISP